jgi:hypothetical protein
MGCRLEAMFGSLRVGNPSGPTSQGSLEDLSIQRQTIGCRVWEFA